MNISFRQAVPEDFLSIDTLIKKSARVLQVQYYSESEVEAALELVSGVAVLVGSGNYFVAESGDSIIGCGGFCFNSLESKEAEIRAFFIDPDFSRKGVAAKILSLCETQCVNIGVESLVLRSTLSGEPFYKKYGFVETGRFKQCLSDGQNFELVEMVKYINS